MKISLFAIVLIISVKVNAFSTGWYFGGGAFLHNLNKVTSTNEGTVGLSGNQFYPLESKYVTNKIGGRWNWAPALRFSHITSYISPSQSPDKGLTKNIIWIDMPFIQELSPSFFLSYGPGIFIYELKGKGGTIENPSGTTTRVYGLPSKTVMTKNLTLSFGMGFNLTSFLIELNYSTLAMFGDKKSTNFGLFVTYKL